MAEPRKTSLTAVLISLLIALFSSLLYASNLLKGFELGAYDLRLSLVGENAVDPRIVLVAIDDDSLGAIGQWPWPREVHAQLIRTLRDAGAKAVVFDMEFPEPSRDPQSDLDMARAAEETGNVIVGVLPREIETADAPGLVGGREILYPVEPIRSAVTVAHMKASANSDGVLRRQLALLAAEDGSLIPSLSLAATAKYFGVDPPVWDGRSSVIRLGDRGIPVDQAGRFLINFSGRNDTFPIVSYVDILTGNTDFSLFEGKIVFVGYWAQTMGDRRNFPVLQPLSAGVMGHAFSTQTILDGTFIKPAPPAATMLGMTLIIFLAGILFFRTNPWRGAILLLLLLALYAVFNFAALNLSRVLLDLVNTSAGLVLAYVGNMGHRLLIEQRDRMRITGIFQRYVSTEVVKEILSAGEDALRLGGTKRAVSVLFLDVRGFTTLSEKLPPEVVVEILNHNFEMITRVIFKHGGTLDKFIGDAVMALFNAPLDLPDHPLQAVLAAREIQAGAGEIRRELQEKYGHDVQFGIGINTGEAVVGNIGASTRMDYTAIGDTVNLAARLEANTKPGQILISEFTWLAVMDRVETEPVGPITVKGKSRPVNAYLVVVPDDAGAEPSSSDAGAEPSSSDAAAPAV